MAGPDPLLTDIRLTCFNRVDCPTSLLRPKPKSSTRTSQGIAVMLEVDIEGNVPERSGQTSSNAVCGQSQHSRQTGKVDQFPKHGWWFPLWLV